MKLNLGRESNFARWILRQTELPRFKMWHLVAFLILISPLIYILVLFLIGAATHGGP